MRRLGQIIQNSVMGSVQVSVQQCVLNIANIPSHNSSETYTHVFTTPAIRKIRTIFSQMNGNDNIDTTDRAIRLGLIADLDIPHEAQQDQHDDDDHDELQQQNHENEDLYNINSNN